MTPNYGYRGGAPTSEVELVEELKKRAEKASAALNSGDGLSARERVRVVSVFHEWCTPALILHLIEHYQPASPSPVEEPTE